MPPRYAYWTILVDDQPTAFRAGSQEELMPTFNRLKLKSPSAVMKWWQNGKLWDSRVDAQEMMRARGEMGRRGDERQSGFRSREVLSERRPAGTGGHRESKEERDPSGKLGWKPKGEFTPAPPRKSEGAPEWKPKGRYTSDRPAKPEWKSKSRDDRPDRSEKPEWRPKDAGSSHAPRPKSQDSRPERAGFRREKVDWKPKGAFGTERPTKPDWKPKGTFKDDRPARPDWKSEAQGRGPRRSAQREGGPRDEGPSRSEKPEWKPKGAFKPDRAARPDWKSKSRDDRPRSAWKPKTSGPQDLRPSGPRREGKPEWKPKGAPSSAPSEKRKWVPKEEYKKSQGIEAKRDSKWRPGGLHKDPKQKYKDAKKAKWGRFKETIRKRSSAKPGRKKKDDE